MEKDLKKLNLFDLIDEIYVYNNNDAVIELKRRIKEDIIETQNFPYYILISHVYYVLALSEKGENGYDKLDISFEYEKDDYSYIMEALPINHPARLYFEVIEKIIESDSKYDKYVLEIKEKLILFKKQNPFFNVLDIDSEKEVYDFASSVICIKENELEEEMDRANINNNQKIGE